MTPFEVYFDTQLEIDPFAVFLRKILNLATENQTLQQRDQRREGANYGGLYYLFELLGLELILLTNLEEVAIPERYDFRLYLIVQGGSEATNQAVAERIRQLAEANGVRSCVDSLSS